LALVNPTDNFALVRIATIDQENERRIHSSSERQKNAVSQIELNAGRTPSRRSHFCASASTWRKTWSRWASFFFDTRSEFL